jgi:predicted anti-sigma-YlaC factor YlaD
MRSLLWLNPSCRDAMVLFSRSLDRDLTRAGRIILAVHLLHCPACRRSRRQVSLLVSVLRSLSVGPSKAMPGLPEAVRQRIKQALRSK